jgi:hypothetical protein
VQAHVDSAPPCCVETLLVLILVYSVTDIDNMIQQLAHMLQDVSSRTATVDTQAQRSSSDLTRHADVAKARDEARTGAQQGRLDRARNKTEADAANFRARIDALERTVSQDHDLLDQAAKDAAVQTQTDMSIINTSIVSHISSLSALLSQKLSAMHTGFGERVESQVGHALERIVQLDQLSKELHMYMGTNLSAAERRQNVSDVEVAEATNMAEEKTSTLEADTKTQIAKLQQLLQGESRLYVTKKLQHWRRGQFLSRTN